MKYLNCIFLLVFFVVVVAGCSNRSAVKAELTLTELGTLPDAELTEKQKELRQKVTDVLSSHTIVEDNQLIFLLSKEEFRQMEFPEEYYDVIVQGYRETNKHISEMGIEGLEEGWEITQQNYSKYRDIWNKK